MSTAATDGSAARILIITQPDTLAPVLGDALRGGFQISHESVGIEAVDPGTPGLRRAEAIVVEVDPGNAVMFDAFETFVRDHADRVPVVAAVRNLTVDATRQVLRAGATDVLALPFSVEDLDRAVDPARLPVRPVARAAKPAKRGKIVAFLGAIGGAGTTALATQAGVVWTRDARVCLLDLDIQFGNAALYLDLRPALNLSDIIDAGDRLDAELLETIAERHASGLGVIASPHDMVTLDTITLDLVEKIVGLAAQTYDVVLIDLPAAWTSWSLRALELADLTLLVTGLTVPGIHQAKRQIEIIEANGMADRLQVVVNRVVHPMFGKIDLSETQALLGRRIDHTIANDYPTVSSAVERGQPLATIKSKTRVEKDLRAMVANLSERLAAKAAA